MPSAKGKGTWLGLRSVLSRYLDMPNDSTQKTLFIALSLCLACSIVVSTAAVVLKPKQVANRVLDRKQNIISVAGLQEQGKSVDELFEQVEQRLVDVRTGEYVERVDPESYDQRRAARDAGQSMRIPDEKDIAQIRNQARYAKVYLVRRGGRLDKIVLPVHGYGLWSTLYGFVALEADANTIYGLSFYEHTETPGLGGEVDNPGWKALWKGKKLADDDGKLRIGLAKGKVNPVARDAQFQVDGLAGATLTARGVTNLVRYWMGENGFGPYLEKLKTAEG
jgi:Na+-transporting NADH:ubiquinone oxidoreductase subunit C